MAPDADNDRSVYGASARALLPNWLRTLGWAPWFDEGWHDEAHAAGWRNYHRASALFVLGLSCEVSRDRPEVSYLRECVRAGLVHWQLLLGGDGQPRSRAARRDGLTVAGAAQVVRLLTESTGFQTTTLLEDVARHLRWLAARTEAASWVEALAISALCDAATLVRDAKHLHAARQRLQALLARQDEEGWFRGTDGADLDRWSPTVDALARVRAQHGWPELDEPLRRTLRFGLAVRGTHAMPLGGPMGAIGPYGMELLAGDYPEAALLARQCRALCERLTVAEGCGWDDDECTEFGVSVMFAAMDAPRRVVAPNPVPGDSGVRLPRAGLWVERRDAYRAVVQGRHGGALHVVWRDGSVLNDPGVAVVNPLGVKSSWHATTLESVQWLESGLMIKGVLRRMKGPREPRRRGWSEQPRRGLAGLWRRRSTAIPEIQPASAEPFSEPDSHLHLHLHDHFEREVGFGEDFVSVRDRVSCLLPCLAVVCQSPLSVGDAPTAYGSSGIPHRPPIFVEGGRHVEITRVYRAGSLVEQRVRRMTRASKK